MKRLSQVHTTENATRPRRHRWQTGLCLTQLSELRTYFTPYPSLKLRLLMHAGCAILGYVADLLVTAMTLGICPQVAVPTLRRNVIVLRPLSFLNRPGAYLLLRCEQLRHSTEVMVLMCRLLMRQPLS